MKKVLLAHAVAMAAAAIPAASHAQLVKAEDFTVTSNVNVVSDYRFRGISQTLNGPALQGGFDVSHKSGFYLGNWNSNVSSVSYANGAGLEMDLYGGYKTEVYGVGIDVGNLYYYYPKASYQTVSPHDKYDNNELYLGLSYGPVSGKISYATTNYFGLKDNTQPARANGNPAVFGRGSSVGTTYAELNYSQEVYPKVTLIGHLGHTNYKNYSELSYTDYKIGATYDLSGYILGAALVGNTSLGFDEKNSVYRATSGEKASEALYRSKVVFSIGRTF